MFSCLVTPYKAYVPQLIALLVLILTASILISRLLARAIYRPQSFCTPLSNITLPNFKSSTSKSSATYNFRNNHQSMLSLITSFFPYVAQSKHSANPIPVIFRCITIALNQGIWSLFIKPDRLACIKYLLFRIIKALSPNRNNPCHQVNISFNAHCYLAPPLNLLLLSSFFFIQSASLSISIPIW